MGTCPRRKALGLAWRQGPHLGVVGEHCAVQPGELLREGRDVGIARGIAQEVGELGVGAGKGTGPGVVDLDKGVGVAKPGCVADGLLEVFAAPGRHRLHDGAEAEGGRGGARLHQGDAPRAIVIFAKGAVAPHVLGQRSHVVDVLEALPDGLVAEPLADRLGRVPAVDEQGAGGAEKALVGWGAGGHGWVG